MKFTKFLKSLDYFGSSPNLRINSNLKFKSSTGGIIFVVWISGIISYIIYSFQNFVEKKQMNLITSNEIIIPSPQINLLENKFMWAVALLYENFSIATNDFDQFITISSKWRYQINQDKNSRVDIVIPLKPCNQSDFPMIEPLQYTAYNLANYRCLNNTNFTIEGLFTDKIYTQVILDLKINSNVLKNTTLYNMFSSMIDKEPIRLNSYFVDTAIDVKDIENPFRYYLNNIFSFLDLINFKRIDARFMNSPFTDDSSILFDSPFTKYSMKFHSTWEYGTSFFDRLKSISKDNNRLTSIYIKSFENISTLKRSFQKFQIYLASISSISSGSLILFSIMMSFVNSIKIDQYIILKSTYLKHELRSNLKLDSRKNSNKYLTENKKLKKFAVLNTDEKKINFKNLSLKIKERSTEKNDRSKIRFQSTWRIALEYIFCGLGSKRVENKYYSVGKFKILYYTDILTLIKKFQEIDTLKDILMNPDQKKLFNFISKPIISTIIDNTDDNIIEYKKHITENISYKDYEIEEIKNIYENLKFRTDGNPANSKYLEFFEKKLNKFI
jgi:hypothetical protein